MIQNTTNPIKLKRSSSKKLAILAGTTALAAFTLQSQAQSSDALIDKLVDKGILSEKEAQDLRDETDKDFKTAFAAKTGMPDWVSGYRIGGDFRGRYEQFSGENSALVDRVRFRYRLRFGITVSMFDNLEAGFRLASGDAKGVGSQSSAGNALSANTTFQDSFTRKNIYIDAAYGKWTPINSDGWIVATTIGKMDNPFIFTPMVFDPDLNPEGVALTGTYAINDRHSLAFNSAAFVIDEESGSTHDPFVYGAQILWNAKWTDKISSTLGLAAFQIVSPEQLTTNNIPYVNQGNTRNTSGVLLNNYNPVIADANVTYMFDSAPFYTGAFPVKVAGEYINNPGASANNEGYSVGVTFGKSGTRRTWDISYRYQALDADAWYDQFVDDDNGAFYANTPTGSGKGYFGGTNIKGHLFRFDYSFTDSLTFTTTCYLNSLINSTVNNGGSEPKSDAIHIMADLMWKF